LKVKKPYWCFCCAIYIMGCLFVMAQGDARAQSIQPVPFPDPGIPGFQFPTPENVIIGWTKTNNQSAINKHAWGIWTGLTMETDQVYTGQRLRVFETWLTPQDILSGGQTTLTPRPLEIPRQLTHSGAPTRGEETILGFVKYDPTAAAHIEKNNLFSKTKLNSLLASGAKKIPDFPHTAISLKPVFQAIAQGDLVDGRYYQMAAWPGPPGSPPPPGYAVPFSSDVWNQCIWIDIQNQGQGNGAVDKVCNPDGSSRTPQNTYNVNSFIHFRLDATEAELLNAQLIAQWIQSAGTAAKKGQPLPPPPNLLKKGDYSVLQAMHVTTREITRWTWQTFWWTPNPDQPNFPSSDRIARERPSQLKGAARNYAHAPAYSMVNPPQPNTGGTNTGNSVYAYNPWLEAGFDPSVLPDSEPGMYDGRPVPNNVGVQTNCMSCHAQANYTPLSLPNPPNYTGDRYIDLDSPQFRGTLQVDFLWSIPNNAK
jgi:hypothetical protein